MKNFTFCSALKQSNLKGWSAPLMVLGIFLATLFGPSNILGQSFRTVSAFTGTTSDFTASEKYSSVDNVDYYVTFDATYVYFGAFRTNSNTWGQFDHLTIYVDADAKSGVTTGGNGTTTGVTWDGNTPTLPIQADYRIAMRRNNSGESFYSSYSGSWTTGAANAKGYSQYATSSANGALEVRVPWTDLGSPNGIYFIMYASYNTGYFGSAPNGTSGAGPASGKYFGGIGVSSAGCYPTNTISTAIIDSYSGGAPANNQLYGKVTLTGTSITLNSTTSVAPGGSLVLASGLTFASQSGKTISMASGTSLTNNTGSTTPFTNLSASINFNLSTNYTSGTSISNINGSSTTTTTTGCNIALNAGVNFGASNTTIGNLLTINNNGWVSTNPPIYNSGATLVYNSGTTYVASAEWTSNSTTALAVGIPQHVQVNSGTTLSFGSSAAYRFCNGNFTVNSGGGFTMSSASGGDLKVGANYTFSAVSGNFTGNGRALFMAKGSATQNLSSTASIPYLVLSSGSSVILATDITVSAPNGGNAITFNSGSSSNYLSVNGKTLTIGSAGTACSVSGTCYLKTGATGTASKVTINGNAGTISLNIDAGGGNSFMHTLTIDHPGVTLIDGVSVENTLALTSGTLTFSPSSAKTLNIGGAISVGTGNLSSTSSNATVQFNGTAAQTVPAGTFTSNSLYRLNISNGSGVTLNTDVTTTNNLTFISGSDRLVVGANRTLSIAGTVTVNAGCIGIDASASGATVAFTNGSALTLPYNIFSAADPYNVTLNGAGGVTLGAPLWVTNVLTLTNGILTTSGTNTLTLVNTANTAVSGGSSSSYVSGPLNWRLPNNGSVSTYNFPVGSSSTYLPFALAAPSGTGTLTAIVQAFSANSGGSSSGTVSAISTTEYWSFSTIGTFSGASVSLTRQSAISPLNVIAVSSTASGAYTSLGGTPASSSVATSNDIGATTPRFFLFGQVAVPTVTSVTTNSPISGQTALGNGYFGQTVAIVGTNFANNATVSFNGTSASSVTFNSSTSLTATIPNGCTSGVVTVTNPTSGNNGSSSSFNILGYLSVGAASWNTASTWAGNVVPSANSIVTINSAVTLSAAITNSPISTITITSGRSLTMSSSGSITATTINNNGTIGFGSASNGSITATTINNIGTLTHSFLGTINATTITNGGTFTMSANGILNIAAGGTFTNNGTSTNTSGTVNFVGAGTVNGSAATTFSSVTINSGQLTLTTVPTINGTLTINGGFVSAAPKYGAASTLDYAISYDRFNEWNAVGAGTIGTTPGYPNNVSVSAGTLNINGTSNQNIARAINGTLIVNGGATATMSTTTAALTVGAVTNDGTLTLSSAVGGDLNVSGAFVNTGTFTPNSRMVTFNGSSAQTITGATTFNFVTLNNSAGLTLSSSANVTISNTLTLTAGTLTVGANTLTLSSGISVGSGNINASNGSATVIFNGSAAQSIPAATFTSTVRNLTISNTNSPSGVTLNQNITVNGTLLVNSASFFTIPNNITLTAATTTVSGTLTIAATLSSIATVGGTNNGTLILSSGTPTINGTLTVNGYLQHSSSVGFVLGGSQTMTFAANSVYEVNNISLTSLPFTSPTNPLWNSNSNVIVTTMSNTVPLIAPTSTGTVLGNLTYLSTRTLLYIADANTNSFTATIAGNLTFNSIDPVLTRSYIFGDPGAGGATSITSTININGDVTFTSWSGLIYSNSRTFTGCNYIFNFGGNFIAPGSVNGTGGNGLQQGGLTASQNTLNFTGTSKYLNYNLTITNAVTNITGSYSLYNNWSVASTTISGSLTCYDNTSTAYAVTAGTLVVSDGATIKTNSTTGLNGSFTMGSSKTWGVATYQFDTPSPAAASVTGSFLPTTVANLIINNTNGVTLSNSAVTVNSTLTLSAGALTLTSKTVNIASGGVLTDNGGSIATTGTNGADGGTVNFLGTGTVNGSSAATFFNVSVAGGTTFLTSSPTINGVFTINTNGFISNNSPIYGTASTLFYNQAGSYNRSTEWLTGTTTAGTAGYPNNVTIGSSTQAGAFNLMNSGALQLGGNLNIGASSGSASSLTLNDAATPGALTVVGNVNLNATGTLTLGNFISGNAGDLYVKGNFTRNGTFTHNSRGVFFTGTSAQTITGTTTFDYLIINNTSGGVALATSSACTVNQGLTLTSGIFSTASSNLTIASSGTVTGGGTTTYIDGPLVRILPGSLNASGTYSFPVGNAGTYLPLTLLNATTGATGPTIVVTPTNSNSGGTADGTGLTSISNTEYWRFAVSNGNYSGGTINLTRQAALAGNNVIGKSSTAAGTYSSIGGSTSGTTINGQASPGSGAVTSGNSIYLVMATSIGGTPTVTSVTAAAPITGQTALGNGYYGQTVNIVGTNFENGATVSFNGTAASSVTYNSATSLSVVIPGNASTGVVTVTNPNAFSGTSGSFNQLGYVTNADGAWTQGIGTIWLGGSYPTAGYPVTINNVITLGNTISSQPSALFINSGASLSQNTGTVTINGNVTNSGTWSMSGGNFTTAGTSVITNAGSLNITAGTITIVAGGTLTNNSTATISGGVFNFSGAGTINGTTALTLSSLTINTGTLTLTTVPTINGTFTINGGSVSAAPIYTSNSTLSYAVSYNRFNEWSATGIGTIGTTPGYPNNVTIAGTSTTFDVSNGSNTARALNGALTINSGNTFTMSSMTGLVTASRVSLAGTLTLSSAAGGDLAVTGILSSTSAAFYLNGGTFNSNNRALFLSAAAGNTQYIGNANASVITIPYLIFSNASSLFLNTDVSFTAPNGGNAITFNPGSTTNFININGRNMVVGTAGQTVNVSGTLFVKGGATGNASTLAINGNAGTISLNVDAGGGNAFLNTLTINHPGVTVVNSNNTYIENSLVLTAGTLTIAPTTGTLNFQINGSISRTSGNINAANSSTIVSFNGSSAQSIPASTFTGSIYKLTINNTSGVTTSSDLTISNTLTLTAGLLSTGSNTVILSTGATTSGASSASYVDGKLKQTFTSASAKTFPIGKGGNYRPVVFTYSANPTSKDVTIEQIESVYPAVPSTASTARFGNRYWTITQSATGTNYTVGLNNGGNTPTGTVNFLRREGAGATTSNTVTFSSPTYTNSSSFATTNTVNDVALVETAIPLTIAGVTAGNKTYNGTTVATINVASALLSGVVSPDDVTLVTGSAIGAFATASVGTGKTVTTSGFTLSGANATAYSLTQPSTTADITTATLTITANNTNKTYGTTQSTPVVGATAFTSSGLQNSETIGSVTLAYGAGAIAASNGIGSTSTITPSAATGGTFTASNYSITYNPGTLTVIAGAAGTWAGVTSTAWNVASNWANNTVPTTNTNITIPSGTTFLPVLVANTAVANLTLGSSTTLGLGGFTLSISGAVSDAGIITGTGNVTTTGSYITFSNQHTYTGTTTVSAGILELARTGGNTIPSTSNVVVTATGSLIISKSQQVNDFTLSNSSALYGLAISDATVTLTIAGTYTGTSGGFSNAGTTVLSGTSKTGTGFPGTGVTVPTVLSVPTIGNLTINLASASNTADIKVSGAALNVGGILTLTSGIVTTSTSDYLSVTGAISGGSANSYVSGPLGLYTPNTSTRTFPIGKGGNYRPVTFAYSTSNANNGVIIEQIEGTPTGLPSTVSQGRFGARYYTVTQYQTGYSYNIGLTNNSLTPTGVAVLLRADGVTVTTPAYTLTGGYYTTSSAYSATNLTNVLALGETAIPLIVSGATTSNKTYDATNTATITGASLTGVQGSDVVTLSAANATFASANVGTGIAITSNYSISGTNSAAYFLAAQPTLTARNITAATLTITANNVSKAYGAILTGGSGSTAFTSSGLVGGQTIGSVTITYGSGALAGDAVGTYTSQVTPSAATGGTFNPSNYSISYITGNITVTCVAYTAVLSGTANICASGTTDLTVTVTGGLSPFTVVYSGGTVNSYTSGSNISVSPSSTTTYTLTSVTDANGCTATPSGSATITIKPTGTWVGTTSTWTNAANWCGGVPTGASSVTIEAGYTTPAIVGTSAVDNLTIASGASLTVTGTLQIAGTISNSGTLTATAGTIELNGSLAQSIPAATFSSNTIQNLVINNSNGVTLDGTLNITGTVTPTLGTLNTGGYLVLKSSLTGTARIAQGSGTYLSGNVTVERFITSKAARKYSFIGSTTAQSIRNAWQSQIYITGVGTGGQACGTTSGNGGSTDKYNSNGFDKTFLNTPSMFTYNATPGSNGSRWVTIPNTSDNLVPGKGYRVNIRGDRNSGIVTCTDQLNSNTPTAPEAVVLKTIGTVSTGDVIVALNNLASHAYTLLANPYPSQISFSAFKTSNSIINNTMWTYSPYGNGNYTTYSNGLVTNAASGYDNTTGDYLASGQAFFVEANTGGSVTFSESHKIGSTIPNTQYFGTSNLKLVRIGLKATDNTLLDEAIIRFNNNGSKNYVANWDAVSFGGGAQTVAITKAARKLAIATFAEPTINDSIPFVVSSTANGTYRLSFADYQDLDSNMAIELRDNYLGTQQNVRSNTTYDFSITADSLSKGNNRFVLLFKPTGTLPVSFTKVSATLNRNSAAIKWSTAREVNIRSYEVERSLDARAFSKVAQVVATVANSYEVYDVQLPEASTWYYRIKAIESNGTALYSNIVKLSRSNLETAITIFPNPVKERLNITLAAATANATYGVKVFTVAGKQVFTQTGLQANGNQISIDATNLASGLYLVELTNAQGESWKQKFIKN